MHFHRNQYNFTYMYVALACLDAGSVHVLDHQFSVHHGADLSPQVPSLQITDGYPRNGQTS